MPDEKQHAAVYASFQTFKNAIEGLAQGIPNQIDRSTFPGLSGGVQSQLFVAFKFLGLTDDNGTPTQLLHELAVLDESARKQKLKEILQASYPALFALDLMKTTPQQLSTTLSDTYGVTGATREKATRFFVSAAQYTGIPMSRLFGQPTTNGNSTPRKRRKAQRSKVAPPTQPFVPATQNSGGGGTSRSVTLRSGGTLTITATLDVFQLTPDDRTFVFKLIDELAKYEKEAAATAL